MSQVWPTIAGKRVGSMATFTGALTLNARTYSKKGYRESGLPASSVLVIAAAAVSGSSRYRAASVAPALKRWIAIAISPQLVRPLRRRRLCHGQAPGSCQGFFLRRVFEHEVSGQRAQQRCEVLRGGRRLVEPHDGRPPERAQHARLFRSCALGLGHGCRDPARQLRRAEPYRRRRQIHVARNDADDAPGLVAVI